MTAIGGSGVHIPVWAFGPSAHPASRKKWGGQPLSGPSAMTVVIEAMLLGGIDCRAHVTLWKGVGCFTRAGLQGPPGPRARPRVPARWVGTRASHLLPARRVRTRRGLLVPRGGRKHLAYRISRVEHDRSERSWFSSPHGWPGTVCARVAPRLAFLQASPMALGPGPRNGECAAAGAGRK